MLVVGASHAKVITSPTVTVSVVVPETLLDVAVIVVDPVANELANPLKPAVLLMDATAASDELQITVVVRSCVVVSENVPVAVNCWFIPWTMLGLVGVIAMDTSWAPLLFVNAFRLAVSPPPPPPHPDRVAIISDDKRMKNAFLLNIMVSLLYSSNA